MQAIYPVVRVAALLLLSCAVWVQGAQAAQVAGVVVQVSGPISARSVSGVVKPLQAKSEVESGDTLATAAGAYALVRFIDNSELTLKPGTSVVIDQFSFDGGQPDQDRAAYTLIKGGLRAVTGILGKRNKDKYTLKTPSATIGIRGTTFFLEYLLGPDDVDPSPGLEPGLHVHVSDGGISLVNAAGRFQYDPGQFGFIKNDQTRPVKMYANPGMRFAPPPSFDQADRLTPD